MHLSLRDILEYDKSRDSPLSDNFADGEKLLKSHMLPYCGRINDSFEGYMLVAYCERDDNRNTRPHEIRGVINSEGKILRMSCTCEDVRSGTGQCQHVFATLLYCNRHDLDELHKVSNKEVQSMANADFSPKPLMEYEYFKTNPKLIKRKRVTKKQEQSIKKVMYGKDYESVLIKEEPDDCEDDESPEILEAARDVALNSLPEKSKRQYITTYDEFAKWREEKKTTSFSEEILLDYFNQLSEQLQPSTLWARFSMLRATIKTLDNIDIGSYGKLAVFLRNQASGHKAKKSKVFTADDVSKYCNEAPDDKFLVTKVALIVGIAGACRREELCHLTTNDVEDHNTLLLIKIPKRKSGIQRSFTVVGEFYTICKKYMKLRPKDCRTNRFFLNFQNGKCTQQVVGINKFGGMPKQIATFLNLPTPELYTGHSFRRTSATLLIQAGADIAALKRHGGWKSNTVAKGHVEDSLTDQMKIGEQITSSMSLHASTSTGQTESATTDDQDD